MADTFKNNFLRATENSAYKVCSNKLGCITYGNYCTQTEAVELFEVMNAIAMVLFQKANGQEV